MAKVEDFYLGATHIEIYDDCVVKTQEEVDAILRVEKFGMRIKSDAITRKPVTLEIKDPLLY